MNKTKLILALLFSVYASSALAFIALPYLPLTDDNSWTYQIKTNGFVTGTDTAIVGTSIFNGQATKSVTFSSGEIDYYTNDAAGIKIYGGSVPPSSQIPYQSILTLTPAVALANPNIELGATVRKAGTATLNVVGFGVYTLNYIYTSVAQTIETVTVPAGTYITVRVYSTLRITGTIGGTPIDQTTTTTDWLASGIGVVKELHVDGNDSKLEELVSANLVKLKSIRNDFNGDGISDLVWRQASTGTIGILFMSNTGMAASWQGIATDTGWNVVGTGDFNGDGIPDLLWRQTSTGLLGELFMNSNGTIKSWNGLSTGTDWNVVDTADFNGDGISDLVWRQASTGTIGILFMSNTGAAASWQGIATDTGWNVVGTGDFNGDGIPDLLWRQTSTGLLGELFMNSNGTIKSWNGLSTGTDWNVVDTADFNGDGISDLVWRQASTGTIGILFMSNTGAAASWQGIATDTGWNVVGTGDFNGDGIPDLLWRQTSTGLLGELFMNSNGTIKSWNGLSTGTDWNVTGK